MTSYTTQFTHARIDTSVILQRRATAQSTKPPAAFTSSICNSGGILMEEISSFEKELLLKQARIAYWEKYGTIQSTAETIRAAARKTRSREKGVENE